MAHDFRCPERRQSFLLPPDMRDWLPEDDIVHLILDAVALMDLATFEATHKLGGAGQAPFAPSMLLSLLIYAYSHGVRSSRAIERDVTLDKRRLDELEYVSDRDTLTGIPNRRALEAVAESAAAMISASGSGAVMA